MIQTIKEVCMVQPWSLKHSFFFVLYKSSTFSWSRCSLSTPDTSKHLWVSMFSISPLLIDLFRLILFTSSGVYVLNMCIFPFFLVYLTKQGDNAIYQVKRTIKAFDDQTMFNSAALMGNITLQCHVPSTGASENRRYRYLPGDSTIKRKSKREF